MNILGDQVVILSSVDSTNNYVAKAIATGQYVEGTAIMAHFQTEGRGQRGSLWQSEPGQNLTFSFAIRMDHLPLHMRFLLSKAVTIALNDAISEIVGAQACIKWPNDLLLGNRKVGGVLIEIKTSGATYGVVGVGLNVNQLNFDRAFKATSLAMELGEKLEVEDCRKVVFSHLRGWMARLDAQHQAEINAAFISRLYGLGAWINFEEGQRKFQGMIADVDNQGMLMVKSRQGYVNQYAPKDVKIIY